MTTSVNTCKHYEKIDNATRIGTCVKCGRQVQYPAFGESKPVMIKEGRVPNPPTRPKSKEGGATRTRHLEIEARKEEIIAILKRLPPKQASRELRIPASTISRLIRRWGIITTWRNMRFAEDIPQSEASNTSLLCPSNSTEKLWYLRGWQDCAKMVLSALLDKENE